MEMNDYEEIEKKVLSILKRDKPTHMWEILKTTHKDKISERQTRNAMKFLVSKKYIMNERENRRFYRLTTEGKDYSDGMKNDADRNINQ
jgi:DNA-binding PadR family transcriptional regulator